MTKHNTLTEALAAFQAELPHIVKGNEADVRPKEGRAYKYNYADLTDVSQVVLPLLARQGLAFSAMPTMSDGMFVLAYALKHEGSDEVIGGLYPLPSTNAPAQALGSAITYARRYVLCAVTGVAPGGDDDDAAQAQTLSVDWSARARAARTVPDLKVVYDSALGAGALTAELDEEIAQYRIGLQQASREPLQRQTQEEAPK